MNKYLRLTFVLALVALMAFISLNAWAAVSYVSSTVPVPPKEEDNAGKGKGPNAPAACDGTEFIEMGTGKFAPVGPVGCSLRVIAMEAAESPAAPEGVAFLGDVFKLEADPEETKVQVCYAYPDSFAEKGAKMYKLVDEAWVEIPDAKIADGQICAMVEGNALVSLMGKK